MITAIKKQVFDLITWTVTDVSLIKMGDEYAVGIKVTSKTGLGVIPLYIETLNTLEEAEARYEELLQVMHELNRISQRRKGATDGKEQK